jgi:hypothetical protein
VRFSEGSAEHARIASDLLFGIENSFKAYRGEEKALVDPVLITAKRVQEADLRQKVASDAALAGRVGDPWADIAKAQLRLKALYFPYGAMESRAGLGSDLFRFARALVRAAEERPKANGERLREYTDSRLALLSKSLLDPQPVYPELELLAFQAAGKSHRRRGGHQDFSGQGVAGKSCGAAGCVQVERSRGAQGAMGWRFGRGEGFRRSDDQVRAGHRCGQPGDPHAV